MKILILIKEVYDIKIPLEYDVSGVPRGDWNVSMLNPEDGAAIEAALKVKETFPETHITLVHLGPASGERYIREGIALGCDAGFRIWDKGLDDLHAAAKAFILKRVAQILTYDLILTGTQSPDSGHAQLGILLAAALSVPCITRVITFKKTKSKTIEAVRKLSEGYRERVEAPLPLVVAVGIDEGSERYTPLPAIFEAMERPIPCLDLSELGIPKYDIEKKESLLRHGPLCFPSSRLKRIPAPDSSLSAYERRETLRQGLTVKRESKIVGGDEDSIVEEIFQTILGAGCLNQLRKKA